MLQPGQVGRWAQRFGVADAQVRLDHLLSHVIWAIAELDAGDVVFFGGTALCRTYLTDPPWLRLSEDLDLLLAGDPLEQRVRLEDGLLEQLRREFPTRAWEVAPSVARAPTPALLRADGFVVRVQLLPATGGWAAWTRVPASACAVDLRYEDLPEAVDLAVPTPEGFAAMKLSAWEDRRAPRDLFDLAGLTTIDAFTSRTLDVFTALSGRPPEPGAYRHVPDTTAEVWTRQLAHQTRDLPSPTTCLSMVSRAVHTIRQ